MATAADCLRFERESFGAIHQMLSSLDDAPREETWAEPEVALRAFESSNGLIGRMSLLSRVAHPPRS